MAKVVHKQYTEPIYDGSTGAQVDEKEIYAIGLDIDGTFVPFLTKEGTYIDRQLEIAKANEKKNPKKSGSSDKGAQDNEGDQTDDES